MGLCKYCNQAGCEEDCRDEDEEEYFDDDDDDNYTWEDYLDDAERKAMEEW